MTHQNRETFFYKGEELEKPLRAPPKLPDFLPLGSLCWLGNNGTWSIKHKKLYLVDIHTNINHAIEFHTKQCLRFEFKNDDFFYETMHEPIPVKVILQNLYYEATEDGLQANWFTGNINLGLDEITFDGTHNKYEKYLSLHFTKGILTSEQVFTYDEVYPPETEEAI